MALPFPFANVSVLLTTSLDANFNALGAMSVIPCTAAGTNTITLAPNTNTPTISAYTTMSPVFAFIAAGSNSGATTINVNGVGAKTLYKTGGATAVGSGDIISGSLYLVNYNPALNASAGGFVVINPAVAQSAPTVQRLLSGTAATYTATAGVVRQRVTMAGGGGGGGAQATNAGANGTTSSFQVNATGTAWTAVFGNGGAVGAGANGAGGAGGTDGSTGTLIDRIAGSNGGTEGNSGTTTLNGGDGGVNPRGGNGRGVRNGAGENAKANTGAGGAGGGANATTSGTGGGAGEWVQFWVTGMTTATYTVGAAGAGGAAGTLAGGNGAAGIIIVEEYYI